MIALADEARMKHIPFAGHAPLLVDVGEASDAGQLSVEHLMGVLLATSSSGDELKKKLLAGANINELNNPRRRRCVTETISFGWLVGDA
jgi:hypothetical protein